MPGRGSLEQCRHVEMTVRATDFVLNAVVAALTKEYRKSISTVDSV